MNLVCIDGRITKDPTLEQVGDNKKKVVRFSIACQRDKDHSDFINCVAWENNAEFINKYFKKGDGINITGELRVDSYTNKDGDNVYMTYVLVRQSGFPLQKPKDAAQSEQVSGQVATSQIDDSKVQNTDFDKWNAGKDIQIDPDELPFY